MRKKLILLLSILPSIACGGGVGVFFDQTNLNLYVNPGAYTALSATAIGVGDVFSQSNNILSGSNTIAKLMVGTYVGAPAVDFVPAIIHAAGFTNSLWSGVGGGVYVGASRLNLASTMGAGIDFFAGTGAGWSNVAYVTYQDFTIRTPVTVKGNLTAPSYTTPPVANSSSFTLGSTNYFVEVSGVSTVTLPSATGSGQMYELASLGTITVNPDGTDTINGDTSKTMASNSVMGLIDVAAGRWRIR